MNTTRRKQVRQQRWMNRCKRAVSSSSWRVVQLYELEHEVCYSARQFYRHDKCITRCVRDALWDWDL